MTASRDGSYLPPLTEVSQPVASPRKPLKMPDAQRAEIAKLEALHADHPEGRIFTHLAEAYRKAGELDRARTVLAEGIGRHPDYSSAHVVLARVLVDQGDTAQAEAEFQRVLELDAQNLVALRALGDLARDAGRTDEAVSFYRRLLDIEPSDDDARERIADIEAGVGTESVPSAEAETPTATESMEEPLQGQAPGADDAPWVGGSSDAEQGSPAGEPWVMGEGSRGGETADEPFTEMGWSSEEEAGRDDFPGGDFAGTDPQAGSRADDAFAPPPDYNEPGMMTETIAQVYARQGLYDRAAEVYRQLVRARPDDVGLRTRMEEMEALAARTGETGEAEPPSALASEPAWEGEPDPGADLIFDANPGEAHVERLPGLETSEGPPPPDVAPMAGLETDELDPQTGLRREASPEPEDAEEAEAVESVWTGAAGASEAERSPYAWAPEEGEEASEEDASEPIGAYFRSLLGWSAGAGGAVGAAAPGGAGVAGGSGGPAGAGGMAPSPPAGEESAAGAPPGSEPGPAPEPAPDDDDLDTFRSWLESLKQ